LSSQDYVCCSDTSKGREGIARKDEPPRISAITGGFYLGFILTPVLADALAHIGLGEREQI